MRGEGVVAIAEAVALLCIGLFSGILATMFDILCVGAASFVSHFSLWVLLNALVAVHVESRAKAIWWAIPFNLGFIESYFITTVASYEGFSKSFVVPLALVAIISPLLTFGIWTAKKEKNAYGQGLSLLIVLGTLLASVLVNGGLSIYTVVVCLILAFVLLFMPVRRLSISRGTRKTVEAPEIEPAADAVQDVAAEGRAVRKGRVEGRTGRSASTSRGSARSARPSKPTKPTKRTRRTVPDEMPEEVLEQEERPRRTERRVRRDTTRRDDRGREGRVRERRRAAAASRRVVEQQPDPLSEPLANTGGMSTLGTARVARRSTRSTSRRE